MLVDAADGTKEASVVEKVIGKASIYIPRDKLKDRLIERLIALGADREWSVNHLIVKAIEELLEREEGKE